MKRQIPRRHGTQSSGRGMAGGGKFVLLNVSPLFTVLLLPKESPAPGGGGWAGDHPGAGAPRSPHTGGGRGASRSGGSRRSTPERPRRFPLLVYPNQFLEHGKGGTPRKIKTLQAKRLLCGERGNTSFPGARGVHEHPPAVSLFPPTGCRERFPLPPGSTLGPVGVGEAGQFGGAPSRVPWTALAGGDLPPPSQLVHPPRLSPPGAFPRFPPGWAAPTLTRGCFTTLIPVLVVFLLKYIYT